jgi:uncharacterized protein (DUF2062 family)
MSHPAKASFWQRRVAGPVMALLTQGVSPDQIALTLAVGTACSLLPFLGFTSLLNLGVGLWLRMNQPILQTLNQILGPLQLVLILVYVRIGEKIWGAPAIPISVGQLVQQFKESPGQFFVRFGLTGVHAATAWAISVPVILAGLYFPLRGIMRKVAARRAGK